MVLSECLTKYAAICEVNARWQKRFSVLQQIRGELRPVNKQENDGKYLTSCFPIGEMLNKVAERIEVMKAAALAGDGDVVAVALPAHGAHAVPPTTTGSAAKPSATADDASANSMDAIDQLIPTLTWSDLIDADLLKLFAPLQGMESNFLSAMHSIAVQEHIDRKCDVTDEKEQNMMAWGLLKIFHTWYCEEPDEQQQVELANSMSELSQSLSEHSFFASPRTSPGRQQQQQQYPAQQAHQQQHQQQVPNKKWLSKPSSYTPNIFAAQIKDQLISPSRPTRYTVQENDKILQADVEQKRVVHRGGFGPPILIRSHGSANSSSGLMEPMSVAESVSFVSALPSVVEDPLLKKKKQLRNSASGSALPSAGGKKTLRGMKAANKSAGALTYPTPPPSSPGQLRIA